MGIKRILFFCLFSPLAVIENNSIPKITRKNNQSNINTNNICGVKHKSQEKIQQIRSKTKHLFTGACKVTKHLSNSDSSISTNNIEENQPNKLERPMKGYHTVRFQDNSTCEKEISGSKADSSDEQFSPRVSPKIQRVTEVKKMVAPGSPEESKHIPTKILISGPSPYKPFRAATPTPIVALKGY